VRNPLTCTADGRVLLTLKLERSDGTTHLLFEPIELLERLAALTPRPRINLVLHHGVLAPHSRWRARAVAYGRDTPTSPAPDPVATCGTAHLPVSRAESGCNEAQAPTAEMAATPPSIKKSAPTTYAESSDAR
jgi:hypothetical protein